MPQPAESPRGDVLTRLAGSKSILIIDDNEPVRNAIRQFLERAGFVVCGEAANGLEGIEKAKKLKPDLILLDLAMPEMNGAETASVLGSALPHVPVVIFTMYDDVMGRALARAVGAKAVVAKSEGMDKLVRCIAALLKRPESAAAS